MLNTRVQQFAVLALVLTSVYFTIQHWRSTLGIERGSEALERWELNLQPAREILPKRGTIGFVGEWDVPGVESDLADQETEFILTQYALAPLVLVRGAVAEWNIAILNQEAFKLWESSHAGYFEVTPLKHNIYILHKLTKP